MAKRRVKFACAILAGIIGSTLLTLLPRVAAAEDCLSQPTGEKLDGQQWRYRLDRSSNRRCWYLKDTAANTRDNARDAGPRQASQPTSAWDFAQPAPPKLAPRRADRALAESPSRVRADDDAKPTATPSLVRTQPATSFDDNLQRSAAASWQPLDSVDMDSTASSPATSASSPPDQPLAATDATASPAATEPPAPVKPARPTAPIHKLLLVVVGALSLSGLLASALYRLSKMGRRRRRNRNWQRAIARARRNRDKPRSKSKTVHAGGRTGRPTVRPTIVEAPVATAVRAAPSPAAGEMPPPVVAVAPVKTVDPAAELVDLLASRAAKAAPIAKAAPAVESEPQPAASFNVEPDQAVRAIETPAPAPIPDPAAELVDLLGSHAKKAVKKPPRASRPAAKAGPPAPPAAIEAAPPRLPLVADPAAELANLLESRFVPPPAPQVHRAPARARPPAPVPAETAAKKVVDPITELTNLLEAKESMRSARRANAATAHNSKPAPATPAKPAVDPAAELFDMLEARAARTAPQPARQPIQTAQPAQAAEPLQATRPVRPAQPAAPSRRVADGQPLEGAQRRRPEPIAASHLSKPASQPKAAAPKAAAPRRKKVPAAASADMPVTRLEAPAATEPSERATAPKPGKASSRGPRRRDADQRPLPPALMLEPENDGPTPPLDFIPRPQALRPRMRDIRQDESLDGVQDILARLAKRG